MCACPRVHAEPWDAGGEAVPRWVAPFLSKSEGDLQWRAGVQVCGALVSSLPSLAGLREGAACSLAVPLPSPSLSRPRPSGRFSEASGIRLWRLLLGGLAWAVPAWHASLASGVALYLAPTTMHTCSRSLSAHTHTRAHMGVKACRGARPRGSRQVAEGSGSFGEHGVYWRAGGWGQLSSRCRPPRTGPRTR